MKKKQFSTEKKVTMTIQITEFQMEVLRRMSTRVEGLEIPKATLAATAFTRGLVLLQNELPVELPEVAQ